LKFLQHLRVLYGAGVNDFIKTAIGILLIVIPNAAAHAAQNRRPHGEPPSAESFAGMAVIGLVARFLVGMTSVGSGASS
jgi:hypothetical protein